MKGKRNIKKTNSGDLIISLELLRNKELTTNDIIKTDILMKELSKYQLRKVKQKLLKLGYIKKSNSSKKELKEKTIKLSHKGKKCEWCKKECFVLQKHHYPISHKDKGEKIVNICPNCHYTYHKLLENNNE